MTKDWKWVGLDRLPMREELEEVRVGVEDRVIVYGGIVEMVIE